MPVTASDFFSSFPAFKPETYPAGQVSFWLAQAPLQINETVLAALYPLAAMLFVAHNLTLEAQANVTASNGSIPGAPTGVATSKSVDKVSVSYDVSSVMMNGAESYNATTYGQRLWRLLRSVSNGPIYASPAQARRLPF